MQLTIRELRKRDYKKAIQFASTGMHFDWYLKNRLLLKLYGTYFWYLEMSRATQAIAAYSGDSLAGVLLARADGEEEKYRSPWKSLYIRFFGALQYFAAGNAVGSYDSANADMFAQYSASHSPDGELLFLAADPALNGRGVGTFLLDELARREKGKTFYLYTDSACTYQFYERRGFFRAAERVVDIPAANGKLALPCFLYSKVL